MFGWAQPCISELFTTALIESPRSRWGVCEKAILEGPFPATDATSNTARAAAIAALHFLSPAKYGAFVACALAIAGGATNGTLAIARLALVHRTSQTVVTIQRRETRPPAPQV